MNFLNIRLLPLAAATCSLTLCAGSALATPERCERYAGYPDVYSSCLNHTYTMEHLQFLYKGGQDLQGFNERQTAADRTHAQTMRQMEIDSTQLMQQRQHQDMQAGRAHERGMQQQQLDFYQQNSVAGHAHELAVLALQQQDAREVREWSAVQQRQFRNAALVNGFQQALWGQ